MLADRARCTCERCWDVQNYSPGGQFRMLGNWWEFTYCHHWIRIQCLALMIEMQSSPQTTNRHFQYTVPRGNPSRTVEQAVRDSYSVLENLNKIMGGKGKASISKAHPQRKDHRAGAEGKHNSSIIQKTKLHIFTLLSEAFAFKRSDLSGLSARCSLFFL